MRWRYLDFDAKNRRWRWRFALFPVRIHNQWVWLERYRFRGNSVAWSRDVRENAGKETDASSFVSY